MKNKLNITIGTIEVEGISPVTVIEKLAALKRDLQEKGCEVTITVEGQLVGDDPEEKAGDGTRTRDILLGKKQTPEGGE